ncbi:hypothetical protein M011DRAFT_258255 [Sporormia fimetaria CBS 119925]|uniref:Uncharacterized protein n=1 Tax=Sporormia fimetaria CBS 119925 TaxID=1340428 RepID=A0A6A6UX06_9PLEO|nr:hypothetical protein M011DRAFT_258255 [Sporormia fimetaria CBS 119925]
MSRTYLSRKLNLYAHFSPACLAILLRRSVTAQGWWQRSDRTCGPLCSAANSSRYRMEISPEEEEEEDEYSSGKDVLRRSLRSYGVDNRGPLGTCCLESNDRERVRSSFQTCDTDHPCPPAPTESYPWGKLRSYLRANAASAPNACRPVRRTRRAQRDHGVQDAGPSY